MGYVLTHEAVARALALLERDPALGDILLAPLRLMTRYQAMHDPAVQARNAWAVGAGAAAVGGGGSAGGMCGQKRPAEDAAAAQV